MKKLSVLLFSTILLGINYYGLSNDSFYVAPFINLNILFVYLRIAIVIVLVTYTFMPGLRIYTTRALLGTGGIMLLSLGFIGMGWPFLLSESNGYVLIGDSIILIEGGILAIVLSAELSARKSKFMIGSFVYFRSLFATRTRTLAYYPPLLHSEKVLKTWLWLKPTLNGSRSMPAFKELSNISNSIPTRASI